MDCTIDVVLDVSEKEIFVSVSEGWKFYSIDGGAEVHSFNGSWKGQLMTSRISLSAG